MMYGFYNNWGIGNMVGWFGGGVMMILSWVFVIVMVVWLVREFSSRNSKSNSSAIDVLKERYAKGEITKEQFETMKKDIS